MKRLLSINLVAHSPHIHRTTPTATIMEIEAKLKEFMRSRSDMFDGNRSGFFVRNLVDSNSLSIDVLAAGQTNWQVICT